MLRRSRLRLKPAYFDIFASVAREAPMPLQAVASVSSKGAARNLLMNASLTSSPATK